MSEGHPLTEKCTTTTPAVTKPLGRAYRTSSATANEHSKVSVKSLSPPTRACPTPNGTSGRSSRSPTPNGTSGRSSNSNFTVTTTTPRERDSAGSIIPVCTHTPTCQCLRANIESFDQRRSSTGEVAVMYRIVVGRGKEERLWQVYRRYSEFEALHKSLEQVIPELVYSQLKLPAKRGLRKYIEKDSTQHKAEALNHYLDTILSYPVTRDNTMVLRFLEAYVKSEEDIVQQAVYSPTPLPSYKVSKLYSEYLSPKAFHRPPSCKEMDNEKYSKALTAAVAAATNPRIRLLRKEARVDLLDKSVNDNDK
eukprot:CFRG2990T1